ncbi:MAG: hypothetical protein JNK05_05805 [Myxococcales bacterium]|nr:hypothetical protein [Myxococcales bacterium]
MRSGLTRETQTGDRAGCVRVALCVALCSACATSEPTRARERAVLALPRDPPPRDPLAIDTLLAEQRSIRSRLHREDASSLYAARTDGTHSLSSTEWPVFARVYFALASCALAELATDGPAKRALLDDATRALVAALEPRRLRWIHEHFGDPLVDPRATPSVVVHGTVLYAIERCGPALSDDTRLASAAATLRAAFVRAFEGRPDGLLPSYRAMTWVTDSVPALAALALHARRANEPEPLAWNRWKNTVQTHMIEPRTGLVVAPFNSAAQRAMGPPRGSALLMAVPYLAAIDEPFARAQWRQLESHLLVSIGDLSGAREFPRGMELRPDADSGRVVLGMGESASGFAILAAASMGELVTAERLARSAWAASGAVIAGDRVDCPELPTVGHAIILAGKSLLVLRRTALAHGAHGASSTGSPQRSTRLRSRSSARAQYSPSSMRSSNV